MNTTSRDQLWVSSFDTYYQCYFEELVADALLYRWCLLDDITKWVVAITASGSAIAGWSLWKTEGKIAWLVIAGVSALFAITHSALGVPNRVRNWEDSKKSFATLRLDLETLRQEMAMNANFDFDEYNSRYLELRRRYTEQMSRVSPDTIRTRKLESSMQDLLNITIADQIQE